MQSIRWKSIGRGMNEISGFAISKPQCTNRNKWLRLSSHSSCISLGCASAAHSFFPNNMSKMMSELLSIQYFNCFCVKNASSPSAAPAALNKSCLHNVRCNGTLELLIQIDYRLSVLISNGAAFGVCLANQLPKDPRRLPENWLIFIEFVQQIGLFSSILFTKLITNGRSSGEAPITAGKQNWPGLNVYNKQCND